MVGMDGYQDYYPANLSELYPEYVDDLRKLDRFHVAAFARLLEYFGARGGDSGPLLPECGIGIAGCLAGAGLDENLQPGLAQSRHDGRGKSDSALAGESLLGDTYDHGHENSLICLSLSESVRKNRVAFRRDGLIMISTIRF